MPFSRDQITRARRADLVTYLSACGFRLRRDGRGQYRVPGHGGLIVSRNRWYWHSRQKGGNALDFLVDVLGLPFAEAVEALLETPEAACPGPSAPPQKIAGLDSPPAFRPPPAAPDHRRVLAYLTVVRRLPAETVSSLIQQGLLYEDTQGNCVFPCRDSAGRIRGAFLRGTHPRRAFKGLAAGSDSRYGWWWPPDPGPGSGIVAATESAVDAVSLVTLYPAFRRFHQLSLNGLRPGALQTFLADHREVRTVILALDSDEPGQQAAGRLRLELSEKGYRAAILRPPQGCKDWNEVLLAGL